MKKQGTARLLAHYEVASSINSVTEEQINAILNVCSVNSERIKVSQ